MFSATLKKEIRPVALKFMSDPMEIYVESDSKLTCACGGGAEREQQAERGAAYRDREGSGQGEAESPMHPRLPPLQCTACSSTTSSSSPRRRTASWSTSSMHSSSTRSGGGCSLSPLPLCLLAPAPPPLPAQVVIFVSKVVRARELDKLLKECNFPSMHIDGQMKQEERIAKVAAFRK